MEEFEVTALIRTVVETNKNEALFDEGSAALEKLVEHQKKWRSENDNSVDVPPQIYRIENLFRWLSGEEVSFREDPWIIVAQIIGTQENSAGNINMMPIIHGLTLAAEWDGKPGQEPDWLLELDSLLWRYFYLVALKEFEGNEAEEMLKNIKALSISDRADALSPVDSNRKRKQSIPLEEPSFIPEYQEASKPSPATLILTDFTPDGLKEFRARCSHCEKELLASSFAEVSEWIDQHNLDHL